MVVVSLVTPVALVWPALLICGARGGRIDRSHSSSAASALVQAAADLPPKRAAAAAIAAPVLAASAFAPPAPWEPRAAQRAFSTSTLGVASRGFGRSWPAWITDPWGSWTGQDRDVRDVPGGGDFSRQRRSDSSARSRTSFFYDDPAESGDTVGVGRSSRRHTSAGVGDEVDAGRRPGFWNEEARRAPEDIILWEKVMAHNMADDQQEWEQIAVPADWVMKFKPGTVEYFELREHANPRFVGIAQSIQTGESLKFAQWNPDDPKTMRHIRISEMLNPTGLVPEVLEIRKHPEAIFTLTTSPGLTTLASLVDYWRDYALGKQQRRTPRPIVPLAVALPLMANILRNLQMLEDSGVVHGDLSEHNIYVCEDGSGSDTVIDDFRSACIVGGRDPETSCDGLLDSGATGVSAYRQAPEMYDGFPVNEVATNVWQVGLVFAKMLIGDVFRFPRWVEERLDDSTEIGRHEIRQVMRQHFDLWENSDFVALDDRYSDMVTIVYNMLEKDPRRRWTVSEALTAVLMAARQRNIPVEEDRWPKQDRRSGGSDWREDFW